MRKKLCSLPAIATLLLGAMLSTGCAGPGGKTTEEKVASAIEMRDHAVATVCEEKEGLKEKLEKSAGYVVFSNFSLHPGLFSFARGWGVLTNNATKKLTHQKWTRLTIGPGIAVKGLYVVVLFDDAEAVERFESGPWVAGGQIEAGFVFGDFGGSWEKAWAFRKGVHTYYTTHTGVALELELFGIGKISNNKSLNRATSP